jgi:Ca-activated chloride channel family protein
MCLAGCLVAAGLFWALGLGRPNVAVAIALDLSSSTHDPQPFNAPGTVMATEIEAVRSYLKENDQQLSKQNQMQIFGFGGAVRPLTSSFTDNTKQVDNELTQALKNADLPLLVVSNTTDIDLAIQKGTQALSGIRSSCRELLLVTDGAAPVSPTVIAEAALQRVKINAVVVGADAPALQAAALATKGIYLSGAVNNLQEFFTERFFVRFNSNLKWIIFWLGAAWIALMWTLTLPLDKWIFQGVSNLPPNLAGQLALGNALFWSVVTPMIVWRLFGLPFGSSC